MAKPTTLSVTTKKDDNARSDRPWQPLSFSDCLFLQFHARETRTYLQEPALRLFVPRHRVRRTKLLVKEIFAAGERQRIVADREPRLGHVRLAQSPVAPEPPIRVATQPGSSAFERTSGQTRAIANASIAS